MLQIKRLLFVAVILVSFFSGRTFIWASDIVVVILDDSGSMNERMQHSRSHRIEAASNALTAVVEQLDPETQFGLMLLNGAKRDKHWLIHLGALQAAEAVGKIKKIRADGGTLLGNAMREAADELLKVRAKSIYGVYRLIIISDGEANDQTALEYYLPDILARGIVVDVIGVDMRKDHSLATQVHSYRRADDEQALKKAIDEVLGESADNSVVNQQSDFDLLNALGDLDTKEILKALGTPNNTPIRGVQRDNKTSPNVTPPVASAVPTNTATPALNSSPTPPPQPNIVGQLVEQLFRTICTCMLPLLIGFFIFLSIATRKRHGRR